MIPTAAKRLVWGRGDGSDLEVDSLPFARLSGLLCWENYMLLARYALTAWGRQIMAAPTWDRKQPWLSTLRHIAKECKSFVIGCGSAMHMDDISELLSFKSEFLGYIDGWLNPDESLIVDPDGKMWTGRQWTRKPSCMQRLQKGQRSGLRWQLDIAGHYARPDVFELRVRRSP